MQNVQSCVLFVRIMISLCLVPSLKDMFILLHGNKRGTGSQENHHAFPLLFLFYFLSLSFSCSSSLFASFLPSAALSSAISVMNVLCVSEMEKLWKTVNSRLLTMWEKMRLFCTFKNQSRSPCFIFPRNLVLSSLKERKNDLLKHERHEIASGHIVTWHKKKKKVMFFSFLWILLSAIFV